MLLKPSSLLQPPTAICSQYGSAVGCCLHIEVIQTREEEEEEDEEEEDDEEVVVLVQVQVKQPQRANHNATNVTCKEEETLVCLLICTSELLVCFLLVSGCEM